MDGIGCTGMGLCGRGWMGDGGWKAVGGMGAGGKGHKGEGQARLPHGIEGAAPWPTRTNNSLLVGHGKEHCGKGHSRTGNSEPFTAAAMKAGIRIGISPDAKDTRTQDTTHHTRKTCRQPGFRGRMDGEGWQDGGRRLTHRHKTRTCVQCCTTNPNPHTPDCMRHTRRPKDLLGAGAATVT